MSHSYAQTGNYESGWKLPPLEAIIDSALAHSPLMKGASNAVLMSQYELLDVQRDWWQRFNLSTSVRYGSLYDYSSMAEFDGTFYPVSNLIFTPTMSVGIGATIPLSDLTDRKRKIEKAKLRVEVSENRMEDVERSVKQTVISAYYDVLTAQERLAYRNEIKSSASMLFDQARMDYADNRIPLLEYTRINEMYLNATSEVESHKFALLKVIRILEIIVGIELIK